MEFWKVLTNALGNKAAAMAGAKMIQSGSDAIISRHTEFQILSVNSNMRRHADSFLAQHYKNALINCLEAPINEYEAALLKLGIYFAAAEHIGDTHMQDLLADAISRVKDTGEGNIRAAISLEVLGQTGH